MGNQRGAPWLQHYTLVTVMAHRLYSRAASIYGGSYEIGRTRLAEALPIMRKHLGEPHGYYTTEAGDLNQFAHLWRYADIAEREAQRAALYADPAWLAYRERTGEADRVLHLHILKALEIPI